jgi:hypothetical protein
MAAHQTIGQESLVSWQSTGRIVYVHAMRKAWTPLPEHEVVHIRTGPIRERREKQIAGFRLQGKKEIAVAALPRGKPGWFSSPHRRPSGFHRATAPVTLSFYIHRHH